MTRSISGKSSASAIDASTQMAVPVSGASFAKQPSPGAPRTDASLRDMHHWVRNNLQLVLSLLNLQIQATACSEARTALQESVHRIRALSKVQDLFYQDPPNALINLGEKLKGLFEVSFPTPPFIDTDITPSRVRTTGAPALMSIEQAMPCCLAATELFWGFQKFGAAQECSRTREVLVHSDGKQFSIALEGSPLDELTTVAAEELLEFRLTRAFAAQGGAVLVINQASTAPFKIQGNIRSF